MREGGSSPVLQPVAYLADNDADVDAFIAAPGRSRSGTGRNDFQRRSSRRSAQKEATAVLAPAAATSTGRVKASPAARKIARERGVDLARVTQGSGPGGRILSTDVPAAGEAKPAAAACDAGHAGGVAGRGCPQADERHAQGDRPQPDAVQDHDSALVYHAPASTPERLMGFYKSQKAKIGCSVNDVIVMACAKAIMEFPAMHSRVDGETVLEFPGANIGVAVGMDDGLVVPVVMNAERLDAGTTGGRNQAAGQPGPRGQDREHGPGHLHHLQPRHVRGG